MKTIANTKENNARVKALKKVAETEWEGNIILDSMEKCLAGINLETSNSGFYKPIAIKIDGLNGYFMVNENGTIYCDARIIKEAENKFKIQYMTFKAWKEFEKNYCQEVKLTGN